MLDRVVYFVGEIGGKLTGDGLGHRLVGQDHRLAGGVTAEQLFVLFKIFDNNGDVLGLGVGQVLTGVVPLQFNHICGGKPGFGLPSPRR